MSVALGQTVDFPISLGAPAPAGGVTISLTTSDIFTANITPSAIVIPQGATTAPVQPQITGYNGGTAVITAFATGYTTATQTVQVGVAAATVLWHGGCWVATSLYGYAGNFQAVYLTLSAPAPVVLEGTLFYSANCDASAGYDNMNDFGSTTNPGNIVQGFSHHPDLIPSSAIYWIGDRTAERAVALRAPRARDASTIRRPPRTATICRKGTAGWRSTGSGLAHTTLKNVFGAIEAGGTKFVCAVGTGPDDLRIARFATASPEATMALVAAFFKEHGSLDAAGIGSFGPVDLDPSSPAFGRITSTPKAGWTNYDLRGAVEAALRVPVGFDTDVNAAVLGEARWGAAQDVRDCIYLTVGTGIGGGAIVNGNVVHGLVHPEMGHLRIPHDWSVDPYTGGCPYHGDCLEGLASGPAIEARWGVPAKEIPLDHRAWPLEAHYLAVGLVNLIVTLSPQRILLGGGVMQRSDLLPAIRQEVASLLNGYVRHRSLIDRLEEYIQAPQLGDRAGVLGALVLAEQAFA